MEEQQEITMQSPIGILRIVGSEHGVQSILFTEDDRVVSSDAEAVPETLKTARRQLEEYFSKQRKDFDFPLLLKGTDFQKRVWKALTKIPYGSTKTYKEQTLELGDIKAIRAVASANGKNPMSIVVPCHRVLGSDGRLTGYAGGLWRKKWLLEHEEALNQMSLF